MFYGPTTLSRAPAHMASRSDWGIQVAKLVDALIIAFVLLVSVRLYVGSFDAQYVLAALIAILLFRGFSDVAGLYRPWRGESIRRQFFQILSLWIATVAALLLIAYIFKSSDQFSRIAVTLWLALTPMTLSGWRMIAQLIASRLARKGVFTRNVVVWGNGELGSNVASTIAQSPWLGLKLVAHITDDQADVEPTRPSSVDFMSGLDLLELQAKRGDFDILYIALSGTSRSRAIELLDRMSDTTISVYMVPDYFTTSLFHGKWSNLEGIPLISVFETPFWGVDGWLKRAQDIVVSVLILIFASLPMLGIAIAVKLTSPGPVLFKQRRYGIDGRQISVWKFRTMRVCEDGKHIPQATKQDPRVTLLGRFLRSTSLDELPQFFNVLMGDMSVVGPRPHAVAHNELYRKQVKGYMLRHKVRPGITGWAQVNGWRGETDTLDKMKQRVEHDLWYIRNWSLWLDLKIILLTGTRGLVGTNAY